MEAFLLFPRPLILLLLLLLPMGFIGSMEQAGRLAGAIPPRKVSNNIITSLLATSTACARNAYSLLCIPAQIFPSCLWRRDAFVLV